MSGLDLYLNQRVLALLFVYAAVTGFCLGGLYDVFRFLRLLTGEDESKKSCFAWIFRFIADVVFVLAAIVALLLLSYFCNDGRLRAPAVVGIASGFYVYKQTVSRLVIYLFRILAGWIRRVLRGAFRLLGRPLLFFGSFITHLWCRLRVSKKKARDSVESDCNTPTTLPPPA